MSNIEQTLSIIKPDAVERNLVGEIKEMFENNGFGSKQLNSWLKEMQKNKMLRLFGIAETDGGELFVADHAKK